MKKLRKEGSELVGARSCVPLRRNKERVTRNRGLINPDCRFGIKEEFMKTKAAILFEVGKKLDILEVDLEPPRMG
ncbi:MAG: hypothetical protein NTX30_21990, partial [Deltaproteobacteria bacterium]|nr:hypothetical protein [Deltaproteobacteria bacterium]